MKMSPRMLLIVAAEVPPPGTCQTMTASAMTIAMLRRCLPVSGPTSPNDSRTPSGGDDVGGAVAVHHRVAPHPLVDLLALQHLALGVGEQLDELELAARQIDRPAAG